jgi:hypothetical protein
MPSPNFNVFKYLKSLYTDFSTNSSTDKAMAIIFPLILIVTISFLVLLIGLIFRKKDIKDKLNKTPGGSPPSSDSEVSIAKADVIPRPSSVV